jgi:hypothetical protein
MSFMMGLTFDELDNRADITNIFPTALVGAQVSISSTTPLGVGKSFALNVNYNSNLLLPFASDQAAKTIYAKFDAKVAANYPIISLHSSATANAMQIGLVVNASNYLTLRAGTTVLATGTTWLDPNVFHTFQVAALIANAGGTCAVYLNGNPTPEINFTGDTQNQSTNAVNSLVLGYDGANSQSGALIYDLVVFNSDGSDNNSLIPATMTKGIMHGTADGATTWAPSTGATIYPLIDEPTGAPNDADYGKSSTVNNKNRAVIGSPPADVGTVAAVQVYTRLNRQAVGTIAVKTGVIAGANEQQSADKYLPISAVNYVDSWEYKTGTTPFSSTDITGGALEMTAEISAVS